MRTTSCSTAAAQELRLAAAVRSMRLTTVADCGKMSTRPSSWRRSSARRGSGWRSSRSSPAIRDATDRAGREIERDDLFPDQVEDLAGGVARAVAQTLRTAKTAFMAVELGDQTLATTRPRRGGAAGSLSTARSGLTY